MTAASSPASPGVGRRGRSVPLLDVSLAEVYRIDFQARDVDLPTWDAVEASAPVGDYLEVGVGFGRVAARYAERRRCYGIEPDLRMVYRARELGVWAVRGEAQDPRAWADLPTDLALVVCAYSTLYLVQHAEQAQVLRLARAHLAPGGVLAVEAFVPGPVPERDVRVVQNPSDDSTAPPWVRSTSYEVDAAARRTVATRLYGPAEDDWRLRLTEQIFWRSPEDLLALFDEAGLRGAEVHAPGGSLPVAPGHVVVVWRNA